MAEFKKLSDVNVIESAGETTNLLAEENGEIVKIARNNAFNGLVKSVNGIMPDENGNISSYHLKKIQFADGSAFVPGLITPYYTETISEIIDMLRSAEIRVIFERMNMHRDGTMDIRNQIGYELISSDDDNENVKVYFGDDLCPIILDSANNKMIFDPDWVAPVEPIPAPATAEVGQVVAIKAVDESGKPTEWEAVDMGGGMPEGSEPFQQLVTDGSGVAKWEDKSFGEKMEEVVFVEKITFTPETPLVKLSAPFREINVGQVYHVMLDGERYDVEASYSTGILEISASNGVFKGKVSHEEAALTIVALPVSDSGYIGVEHTIEVLTTEETVKTIDPKYLPDGGLVKTAIFKGDQYDATVASLATGASRPTTVHDTAFDCINMAHAEALAHIQAGGVLTALILTNANTQLRPQALHATVRYTGSRDLPDLIEVFAYDDAGDNNVSTRTGLRWTADSIACAFTQTNKEPVDDVPEWT